MLFNVAASAAETAEDIRSWISGALARPVRWRDCLSALRSMNPRLLFEIGPNRVLAGLARANGLGGETQILNVNNLRGLQRAMRTVATGSF
jgi:malonyl CoA-acyl carrier protein transacylase